MTANGVATTPETLLAELAARGVEIEAKGDKIRLHPASLLTSELRDGLREHKAGVIRLVRLAGLTPDEREAFEERAAIAEFDGRLSTEAAEAVAWSQVDAARAAAGHEHRQSKEAVR